MTKEQEYFWQQYDGLVRAIDLPQDYKVKDTRIYCVNNECWCKDRCVFWKRFADSYMVRSKSMYQHMIKSIKKQQTEGLKRCAWDKHFPLPNYFNASFGFYAEQKGVTPCECYVEQ